MATLSLRFGPVQRKVGESPASCGSQRHTRSRLGWTVGQANDLTVVEGVDAADVLLTVLEHRDRAVPSPAETGRVSRLDRELVAVRRRGIPSRRPRRRRHFPKRVFSYLLAVFEDFVLVDDPWRWVLTRTDVVGTMGRTVPS